MDQELRQRATAFARVLDAFVHREPLHSGTRIPEHDTSWDSSSLVATWLENAIFLKPPLGEQEADQLLEPGRFDALKAKLLARVVFGRVSLAGPETSAQLSVTDQADFDRLRKATYEADRAALWIPEDLARATHMLHLAGRPRTPTWPDIATPGALEPRERDGAKGYILRIGRGEGSNWLREGLPIAAAKLWHVMARTATGGDVDALRAWLERLHIADVGLDAAHHLPQDMRERLLSAALELLRSDPNYGDLRSELGPDPAASDLRRITQAQTCAAVHVFWSDTHWEGFDETRTELFGLVALIVRFDSLDDSYSAGCARIRAIAELGREKPHLIYELSLQLRASRADAIAWLLTYPTTTAYALNLLPELSLQEQTMMDDAAARTARSHEHILILLRDALPIYCRTLAQADKCADDKSAIAPAVLDSLRAYGRRATRGYADATPANATATKRAEELFSFVTTSIADAGPGQGTFRGIDPDASTLLLAECLGDLLECVPHHFREDEAAVQLRVELELLRFLHEHAGAFASRPSQYLSELREELVPRIAENYARVLELDAEERSFRIYIRAASLLRLPWEYFPPAARALGSASAWLHVPAVQRRVLEAVTFDELRRADVLSGSADRLRVHLGVLLRAYEGSKARVLEPRDARDETCSALERAIAELVIARTDVTRGTIDIFDEEIAYSPWDDEMPSLIEATLKGVARFGTILRDQVLIAWIDKTAAPGVLLAIEKDAPSLTARIRAGEKLADPLVLANTTEGGVVRVVELIHRAASGGHDDLVARLLARGDNVSRTHPWRAVWEQRAFDARLLLFYRKKDRQGIADLPVPDSGRGQTNATRDATSAFEQSRDFYLALLDLETDPRAAERSFEQQLSGSPTSSAILTNLFVAKLEVAKTVTDATARRAAYAEASNWWDRVTAFRSRPRDPVGTTNEFSALDGAELDDELDRRWSGLDELARNRVELIAIRIKGLVRRGMAEEAARLVAMAKRNHGDGVLAAMDVTEPVAATIAAPPPSREDYQRYWSEIRVLPASDISRVLGHPAVQDYLLRVHVNACERVLRLLPMILALGQENRANDIIVAFVAMQLALHDWTAQEQSSGGLANSDRAAEQGTPGERDWIIAQGPQEIAICEAFRLSSIDKHVIRLHVTKLIERYNPSGASVSFILVYFEGVDFRNFADGYRTEVGRIALKDSTIKLGSWHDLEKSRVKAFRAALQTGSDYATQDHILVHLPRTSPSADNG